MENKKNMDSFFRDVASLYAEREGERHQKELAELEKEDRTAELRSLDQAVKGKITGIKRRRLVYKIVPAAAALLIFVSYLTSMPVRRESASPSTATSQNEAPGVEINQNDFVLLSAKLPAGYELTGMDTDQGKTIYYIDNDMNNSIVLVTEQGGSLGRNGFQEILINDTKAYVLVKKDYSVLTYEKEELIYTLTSPYDYRDLIELSESLV